MDSTSRPAGHPPLHALSPTAIATLVENARALQSAAEVGATQPLLRGKRYGLIRGADAAGSEVAVLFDRAAAELGAQVAHIRPGVPQLSTAHELQQMAQVLGRLYDAVVCEGVDPDLVQRLRDQARIPIYDGITSPDHLIAKAAQMLGSTTSEPDSRRFVLQALLLTASA
jgi:ornithine carbamoyltransferase